MTRNNNKSHKFDPLFNENPMIITDIENEGGLVCESSTSTQRRHVDDVRLAPMVEPVTNAQTTETPPQTNHPVGDEDERQLTDQPTGTTALRKSTRQRFPNKKNENYLL